VTFSLLQARFRLAFLCSLIPLAIGGCSWPEGRAVEPLLPNFERPAPTSAASAPADSRRLEALRSPLAQQRLAALEAWNDDAAGPLPPEAIDLRSDPDPRVRAAVMGVLANRRPERALQYLLAALDDHDLSVRSAAVVALGALGGADARTALEGVLKTEGEVLRAAAVAGLAQSGAQGAVFQAAADRSWRVRLAVAREMGRFPGGDAAALARRLLDDPSSGVQQEVVRAVAIWPLEQAGPILLEAMGKNGYLVRKTAAEQLAARWPPAGEYLVDAPVERRAEVLGRLVGRFRAEIGPTDVILASTDHAVADPGVNSAVYLDPGGESWKDGTQVLAALDRLAADGSEAAAALVCQAATHRSPEVRRRACEHLAAHPDARHVPVLLERLDDPSDQVAASAARALGAAGRLEDTRPLHRLLTSPNELLRVEAAAALTRLGDPIGPDALERLSYSDDHLVRRQAAGAMGQSPKSEFVRALLRLLDDRPDVRRVALDSLPKVVGQDVTHSPGKPPVSSTEQVALWKEWFATTLTDADQRRQ